MARVRLQCAGKAARGMYTQEEQRRRMILTGLIVPLLRARAAGLEDFHIHCPLIVICSGYVGTQLL